MRCTCIGDSCGLPLRGGPDHCGRKLKDTHPSSCLVDQAHVTYVHGCGWMGPVCKAPASYHEYVTERPPTPALTASTGPIRLIRGPLACQRQRTFFRPCSKGGNRPFRAQNGARIERPGPGGTRLDRALCIRLSGDHLGWAARARGERKKVSLSVHSRPIKRSRHAGPLGTLHAAHVGRGREGSWALILSLLKLKNT